MTNGEVIERVVSRLNAGDIVGAYEDFSDDCEASSPLGVVKGRDQIVSNDEAVLGQLATHHRRIDRMLESGDDVASWFVWSGTVAATDRSFECQVCNVFHFVAGRVARWETYGDFTEAVSAFAAS